MCIAKLSADETTPCKLKNYLPKIYMQMLNVSANSRCILKYLCMEDVYPGQIVVRELKT